MMVDDLTYKLDVLNSNKFGSFIVKNWFVAEFKRNKSDWQKLVEKEDKIADAFTDIIGDKVVNKRKSDKNVVTDNLLRRRKKSQILLMIGSSLKLKLRKRRKRRKLNLILMISKFSIFFSDLILCIEAD